ncbi:transglycosylase SLT domain-containing protein [Roseateles sp. BYS180W]|uniref:Transglycosylase SLT domain-containing protein n=1 Tax=Roseateles rivi TaxID=3299028 RepID=A0ABW7FZK2_9BURK
MTARQNLRSLVEHTHRVVLLVGRDIAHGLLIVSHNTLALVGLAVLGLALLVVSQASLRQEVEREVLGWLNQRHEARAEVTGDFLGVLAEPEAVSRATAADPKALTRQQSLLTQYISRKYRVAPEPVARLVKEAWDVGQRARLEPSLILAIMAIESGFNPFAQSPVGAQGLMQVMTRVHDDKYQAFGGQLAAFDPVTNLRVGVQVLKECIQRAGSLEEGLRYYVGAANLPDDAGYTAKVLAEQELFRAAAAGLNPPLTSPTPAAAPAATPPANAASPANPGTPASMPTAALPSTTQAAGTEQIASIR